ncbi:C1 family peptidase [Candidatus Woesearchaeota archaeon]|nr:C1 family peptidase [Candidatus Woesearchaeota archaeon]
MTDLELGFSGIRSQGRLGSCSAFAAVSAVEYIMNRTEGKYGKNAFVLSPLYTYFHCRTGFDYSTPAESDDPNVKSYQMHPHDFPDSTKIEDFCARHDPFVRDMDVGAKPSEIVRGLKEKGVCDETGYEYDDKIDRYQAGFNQQDLIYPGHGSGKFALYPPANLFKPAHDTLKKYVKDIEVVRNDPDVWVRELNKENPVIICLISTKEFQAAKGVRLFDTVGGTKTEGHAVVLVGYDKNFVPLPASNPSLNVEAFKIRNSWGKDWGIGGYIWVTKDALLSMANPGVNATILLRPKHAMRPLPGASKRPLPPQNIPPVPPGFKPPKPPKPTPTPTPGPVTPPPGPGPGPHPPGHTPPPSAAGDDFVTVWWLFDNEAQFTIAKEQKLSPMSLRGRGRRIDGPLKRRMGNAPFSDADPVLGSVNPGAFVGLGACRLSELKGIAPEGADGFWKWDGKKVGTEPSRIVIEKKVSGTLPDPVEFEFKVTKPDGSVENIKVAVPAGRNPVNRVTVETIPGVHKIEEQDMAGFKKTTPDEANVDISPGKTVTATFRNKKEEAPVIAASIHVIPKKNAALPHPPNNGTTSADPVDFVMGSTMTIPSGAVDSEEDVESEDSGSGEIDFVLEKPEGEGKFAWACYVIREEDLALMKQKDFNIRVLVHPPGKGMKGNDYHGFTYYPYYAGKEPSDVRAKKRITFDPYLDIPDKSHLGGGNSSIKRPTPGTYRLYLELIKWPDKWKSASMNHVLKEKLDDLNARIGKFTVIDSNYIRFRIVARHGES